MAVERAYFQSKRRAFAGVVAIVFGGLSLAAGAGTFAGASVKDAEPVAYSGNPGCPEGYFEFKIDKQPANGTYEEGDPGVVVSSGVPDGAYITISNLESPNGRMEFDFTSNVAWSIVLVKQGDGGLKYEYGPAVTNDQNVQTVTGANEDGISHVTFCGTTPPATTTTAEETTTTAEETTTTAEETTTTAEETTTTAEETTTTAEATTTTAEATTTTEAQTTTSDTVLNTTVTQELTTTTDPGTTTSAVAATNRTRPTVGGVQVTRARQLPRTGADALPLTEAGAVLVMIGFAFLASSRIAKTER